MKKLLIFGLIVFCYSCKTQQSVKRSATPVITLLSETENLSHAESVVYDSKFDRLYVSVQGEQEPGDGGIVTLDLNGNILNTSFTTGLDNPKGIAISGDHIYVSDVTKLVEIERKSGKVLKKYSLGDEQFLNDVTVDKHGNVYVSDMSSSSIYRLNNDQTYTLWHRSPLLENPNGLLAVDDQLYIAAWGLPDSAGAGKSAGRLLKLDINSKQITNVTSQPKGNLDGIQEYGKNHFLISDWRKGMIYLASKSGDFKPFFTSEFSVGDILFIEDKNILALPLNRQNKVQIYSVK